MVMPRVGKVIFSLLLFSVAGMQGQISLDARTMQGEKLHKAGVGQPFNLEVTIEGAGNGDFSTPEIASPLGPLHRTGFKMVSVNGASRVTYTFTARVDKPGTYTFGPARVKSGSAVFESEPIEIVVSEQAVAHKQPQQRSHQKNDDELALARLFLSSNKAVVGEKIYATLRFYRLDPSIEFHAVVEPEQEKDQGYLIKNRQDARVGREKVNGIEADYIQWQWEIYPNKTGEIVVPAYRIDYSMRPERYDFFSTLFGARVAKTIYSNAATLAVDPLPPHKGRVDGIGHCDKIYATLEPAVMHEGEGATLTITLEGDVDVEQFPLQRIPDALKVYESKKYSVGNKQSFEYIVQAKKAGEIEIPSQSFTYFDVEEHTYSQLRTNALPVTILKSENKQTANDEDLVIPHEQEHVNDESTEIKGITRYFHGMPGHTTHIPLWLFIVLVLLPLLLILWRWMVKNSALIDTFFPRLRRWRSIRTARANLARAQAKNDYAQLYSLFIPLFAALLKQEPSAVTGAAIEHWFEQHATREELIEWEHFFIALNQARFFTAASSSDSLLFDEAEKWISFFKKRAHV